MMTDIVVVRGSFGLTVSEVKDGNHVPDDETYRQGHFRYCRSGTEVDGQ